MITELPEANGPWKIRGRTIIHDSPWLRLTDHQVVQPDGRDGVYGVVQFKNLAIGILPIDAAGNVVLVGQHRFALGEYSWELPEGGGALDQPPLETAMRELREETGLVAGHYQPLCFYYPSNSVTNERAYGFVAWDLTEGEPQPDPTELFERRKIPFRDALELVISGEIADGFTMTMMLMAAQKARQHLFAPELNAILMKQIT